MFHLITFCCRGVAGFPGRIGTLPLLPLYLTTVPTFDSIDFVSLTMHIPPTFGFQGNIGKDIRGCKGKTIREHPEPFSQPVLLNLSMNGNCKFIKETIDG
jgi:hypothetical protein